MKASDRTFLSGVEAKRRAPLRIGLAFNLKPTATGVRTPAPGALAVQTPQPPPDDLYAEWDDEATIAAVESALAEAGEVIRLEAKEDFPLRLREARPDIVFNLAEGLRGANREAHVPAFCEFWGIPYTGSDPMTLSICLDKGRTKELLAAHGIATAAFTVVHRWKDLDGFPGPPVIVKPLHEGSSKGITQASFCRSRREIEGAVASVLGRYDQPALVERWLPGREFTCAVLGNGGEARVLPIVELNFAALPDGAVKCYSYEAKWVWDTPEQPLQIFHCPAAVSRECAAQLERTVLAAYRTLRCRDWARIDLRCDAQGVPHVLEVNPIPGILPDPSMNSCFPKAARAAGMDYNAAIMAVLRAGAARYGLQVPNAPPRAGTPPLSPQPAQPASRRNGQRNGHWPKKLQEGIASIDRLIEHFGPQHIDREAVGKAIDNFTVRITPEALQFIKAPGDPFWRQYVPGPEENEVVDGVADALSEDADSPVPNITHRYPDRVLFLVSPVCATYCRFCTRRRKVGDPDKIPLDQFDSAFDYIRQHTEVRDVILSGGDPLMLSDRRVEYFLKTLRAIPHVEIVRIHTRIPCHLPERITQELCGTIARYHPVYVNVHFNHPDELTPAARTALALLADAGCPLGCQTVLLKGVNDSPAVMKRLMRELLTCRVRPYYLYQADAVAGAEHFRTSVEKGLEILQGLRGWTSGLAVPHFVIDAPGGGGKIPLLPNYVQEITESAIVLRNYAGKTYRYPLPKPETRPAG
jgi:lysine 2,3-aminomutase